MIRVSRGSELVGRVNTSARTHSFARQASAHDVHESAGAYLPVTGGGDSGTTYGALWKQG